MLTKGRVFALDSLAQSCGLSLPTLTQTKDRLMLDQLDSLIGNCGSSLPTLFERIGSMAAHGQHHPQDFTPRACSACGGPSLPDTPATRNAGPEVPARPPVKTTASSVASRTGQRLGNRDTDGEAKGFTGPSPNHHTPQTGASSEDRLRRRHRPPLHLDRPERLHKCAGSTTGNGGGDKPSRGPTAEPAVRRVLPSHACFGKSP